MKNLLSTIILLCCVCYSSKGIIYRHDVPVTLYRDLANNPQFHCVGRIYIVKGDSNRLAGSCVLIAGKYVVTAAHVLKVLKGTGTEDYKIGFNGRLYHIASIRSYSSGEQDIAIVKLTENVKGITPAIMDTSATVLGDTITMIGYGAIRPSDKLDGSIGVDIKAGAQNITDSMGNEELEGMKCISYSRFDDPLPGGPNVLPLEGISNGGDSGGGIFVNRNGRFLLTGIIKGGQFNVNSVTGLYGSVMSWCTVAAYRNKVKQAIHDMGQ